MVHQFFKRTFQFTDTCMISLATLSYTSYLLHTCSMESVEVAVAAVLPCFWVYREVGNFIAQHSDSNNPFARWIDTYSSKEFDESVNEIIDIFDSLASKASDEIRERMLSAFYKSTCLELHFWNDAYNIAKLDSIHKA